MKGFLNKVQSRVTGTGPSTSPQTASGSAVPNANQTLLNANNNVNGGGSAGMGMLSGSPGSGQINGLKSSLIGEGKIAHGETGVSARAAAAAAAEGMPRADIAIPKIKEKK